MGTTTMVCAAISDGDNFNRRRILPEEIRRNRVPPPVFDGSFRWFTSPNIVDMWHYRSPTEKQRIIAFIRHRRWAAYR
jgi:hypothetical protein